ncbi:MAG: guanylate kinase [Pyrinomonadaceae bacterium]
MIGNLIIISSPSGGGKGTLIREIFKTLDKISYSISYTTRTKREGEVDGRDYFFISQGEFSQLIDSGEFLEYAEVHGNFYGTSLRQVEAETGLGRDIILEIDVQGAHAVLAKKPDAISIFILPPSFEILRQRLTDRGTEKKKDLELRLKNSFQEVSSYKFFQYVVINREIQSASNELKTIILAERLRSIRQTEAIQDILNSFDVS